MKIVKFLLLMGLITFCFSQNKIKANAASDLQEKVKELEEIIKKQEDLNSAKVKYLRQEIDDLQKSQEKEEKEAKKKDEFSAENYKKLQEIKDIAVELFSTPDPANLKFSSISKKEILEKSEKLETELKNFVQYLKKETTKETTLTPTPPLAEEKGPISTKVKVKEKISIEKKKEDMGPSQPITTPEPTTGMGVSEMPTTPTPSTEPTPTTPETTPTAPPTGMGASEMPPMPTTPTPEAMPGMGMSTTPAPTTPEPTPSTEMPTTTTPETTPTTPPTGMGASEMPPMPTTPTPEAMPGMGMPTTPTPTTPPAGMGVSEMPAPK